MSKKAVKNVVTVATRLSLQSNDAYRKEAHDRKMSVSDLLREKLALADNAIETEKQIDQLRFEIDSKFSVILTEFKKMSALTSVTNPGVTRDSVTNAVTDDVTSDNVTDESVTKDVTEMIESMSDRISALEKEVIQSQKISGATLDFLEKALLMRGGENHDGNIVNVGMLAAKILKTCNAINKSRAS